MAIPIKRREVDFDLECSCQCACLFIVFISGSKDDYKSARETYERLFVWVLCG